MFANLLKWLLSLVEKAPPPVDLSSPADDGLYSPKERLIYRYFDGQKDVQADPIALYKVIMEDWSGIDQALVAIRAGMADSFKGHDDLVARLRAAFKVLPLEQGGLTEEELGNLFEHFLAYSLKVKKNSSFFPVPPGATLQNLLSSTNGSPPTSNSSDSGGTETSTPTSTPEPSSTGSGSPSEASRQGSLTIERLPTVTARPN